MLDRTSRDNVPVAGLSEWLRLWLLRQEGKLMLGLRHLAFRPALHRAYQTFKRQHRVWADSLFDEHFLTYRLSPLWTAYRQGGSLPVPQELATAWIEQLRFDLPQTEDQIAVLLPVATDFLRCLDVELQRLSLG